MRTKTNGRKGKRLPKRQEIAHIPGAACASGEGKRPLRWLLPGAIPRGCLVLIDGRKGVGKSTMLAGFAAAMTGGPLPPGWVKGPARSVLWITAEEDYRAMVWPRLEGCGADIARCLRPDLRDDDGAFRPLRLPSGIDDLDTIVSLGDVGLVIMDPVGVAADSGVNLREEESARGYLEVLADLAARRDVTFLCARHIRKGNAGDVRDHGLGCVAVGNVARAVLRLDEHPHEEGHYTLSVVATNIGKALPTQVYRLTAGAENLARVEWVGHSTLTAEEIAEGRGTPAEADARHDAEQLLVKIIKKGWVRATTIAQEAERAGISTMTLRRAKVALRVRSRRVQQGKEGHWEWGYPKGGWPKGLEK